MDEKVISILRVFLYENCLPQKEGLKFKNDENLFDAGVIDSAALIHFIEFIEEEFDLDIPDEDLIPENFISINDIAEYIHSQIKLNSGLYMAK